MKGYLIGISLTAFIVSFSFILYNEEWMPSVTALQVLTKPGEISLSHSDVKDDCSACHTAVKGPSPEKCMACHVTNERFSVWPELRFHAAIPNCRGCHREHMGTGIVATKMDHDLLFEKENRCATCHINRDTHDRMFGAKCGSCHNTEVWMIAEFRHPSRASTDCSQCHRAPPCHFTSHFEKVCGPVAGQENPIVSDCHACHQIPAWNDIKGAGWYMSH